MIPTPGETAPYEEVKISPFSVNVVFHRNHHERTNKSLLQEPFRQDPVTETETRLYEEVTWSPLGYTKHDKNRQNETNVSHYKELEKGNSGYVIPYT